MTNLVRGSLIAAGFGVAILTSTPGLAEQSPPRLTQPVNDFAGVIDAGSAKSMDERIRALHKASGDVVVVATTKTFKPWSDIRSYATSMFENHGSGIGAKGKDNGLLVLLAVDDRQVWVEVGYDLEAIVTDGFAGETSRQVMAPRFREGAYGQGLLDGTSRLIERIADARKVAVDGIAPLSPAPAGERLDRGLQFGLFALVVIALIIVASIKGSGGPRPPRRWRGGVGPWGGPYYGGHWGGGTTWRGSSGGFGGFGGGRSGGGGGGASW